MHTFQFKNGDVIPLLGLGTWKAAPGEVYKAIRKAIEIGYRHIDCAKRYNNEAEIGQALNDAIKAGDVKREELWITSKLWNNAHKKEHVEENLRSTLSDLHLDYIDLYLIHWPVALKPNVVFPSDSSGFLSLEEVPLIETWSGMEDCKDKELARHIGVSNFSQVKIESLLAKARLPIEANQIELHPFLQQQDLVDYCQGKNILVTGFSPLGSMDRPARLKAEDEPILLEHPVINSIAQSKGCTPAQVLINWALNRGTSVIPKSSNPKRLQENFDAQQINLTEEEMTAVAKLDKHYRYIDGSFWAPEGSPYTVESLWNE